jgi:hypothetical protein
MSAFFTVTRVPGATVMGAPNAKSWIVMVALALVVVVVVVARLLVDDGGAAERAVVVPLDPHPPIMRMPMMHAPAARG